MTTKKQFFELAIGIGLVIELSTVLPAAAQPSLGTAADFGVLAGAAVTNTGATVIAGHVGVSPGTSITGFPPGMVILPGTLHSADAVAAQAQIDLTAAYDAITLTPVLTDLTGTDLGGLVLQPGVYGFTSTAQLTGPLVLDGLGDPNAVFIFKIGSALTTATASSVSVINGASTCNIFWHLGTSATLGTTTAFAGNILAQASITLNTGAGVSGRLLAREGAVTLDGSRQVLCGSDNLLITGAVIPTLSEWGLALFAFLAALISIRTLRRRGRASVVGDFARRPETSRRG